MVHGAEGVLEGLCVDAGYALSLHSLWEPSFSLLQYVVKPLVTGCPRIHIFSLYTPRVILSLLYSTEAGAHPYWRKKVLGWRKGLVGMPCPGIASGPNCPGFGLEQHPCIYKQSKPTCKQQVQVANPCSLLLKANSYFNYCLDYLCFSCWLPHPDVVC